MGYKNVCLNCKRVENLGTDYDTFRTGECPKCSTPMDFVSQKFRPPKQKRQEMLGGCCVIDLSHRARHPAIM